MGWSGGQRVPARGRSAGHRQKRKLGKLEKHMTPSTNMILLLISIFLLLLQEEKEEESLEAEATGNIRERDTFGRFG